MALTKANALRYTARGAAMPDDFAQLYETAATLMHLLERNRQSSHTTTSSQTTTSHDTPPHTYTENPKQKRQPNEMRDSRDGGSLAGGANSHSPDNKTPDDAQGMAIKTKNARQLLAPIKAPLRL